MKDPHTIAGKGANQMKAYRVWYNTDHCRMLEANSAAEAKRMAKEMDEADGATNRIVKVECLDA